MALGSTQPLTERAPGIYPRDKGGRWVGPTTFWPSSADCLEIPRAPTLWGPSGRSLTLNYYIISVGVRGGAVGWGTALQAGRSRVRFPMVSLEIFHWHNPSGRTVALGSTQSLTEMNTRNISWGVKAAGAWGWQPYHLHVPIVLKSGSLKLLEPSGPVQALYRDCFTFFYIISVGLASYRKRGDLVWLSAVEETEFCCKAAVLKPHK